MLCLHVPALFLHLVGFGFSTTSVAASGFSGTALGSFLDFFFGGFDAPSPDFKVLACTTKEATGDIPVTSSLALRFLVVFFSPVSSGKSELDDEAGKVDGDTGVHREAQSDNDGGAGNVGEPGVEGSKGEGGPTSGALVLGGDLRRQFPRAFGLPLFLF